eukprot:3217989-Rhodomonas_salina.2
MGEGSQSPAPTLKLLSSLHHRAPGTAETLSCPLDLDGWLPTMVPAEQTASNPSLPPPVQSVRCPSPFPPAFL